MHGPAETKVRRAVAGLFRAQSARVVERLAAIHPERSQRNIAETLVEALFPGVEDAETRAALEAEVRAALDLGWDFGSGQVLDAAKWEPALRDAAIDKQIGALVTLINATTRQTIQAAVDQSIREGWATGELQAALQSSVAFSPSRALMVARTETTKAVSAGSVASYAQAEAEGVSVELEWLAAGDAREAHQLLDGLVVNQGDSFVIPSGPFAGHTARYPGDFGIAALDINCRCAVRPRVRR